MAGPDSSLFVKHSVPEPSWLGTARLCHCSLEPSHSPVLAECPGLQPAENALSQQNQGLYLDSTVRRVQALEPHRALSLTSLVSLRLSFPVYKRGLILVPT